jgi:polyhydroxyalkanoate synthesis repressor PhaR
MNLIKRYPNRKLYDTHKKQYITLEEIADLIRSGEDIQVIDHASGEDITALTLTQIIYEQEKKQGGFLPRSILTDLIHASGERLNTLQKALSASVNYWHQIDEEIRHRIQKLVSQGELSEIEGLNLLKILIQSPESLENEDLYYQNEIQQILNQHQVPKRKELKELMDHLDELAEKLDQIELDE